MVVGSYTTRRWRIAQIATMDVIDPPPGAIAFQAERLQEGGREVGGTAQVR